MAAIMIPGIVNISIRVDFDFYQQLLSIGYKTLHLKGFVTHDSAQNAQIVQRAIERTIQKIMDAALETSQPEQLFEVLRENIEREHERQRGNLLAL